VFSRVQEKIQEANRGHKADRIPTVLDSQQPSGSSTPEQRLGIIPLRENYRSLKPTPLLLMDHISQYVFDPTAHGLDLERNKFEIDYQNLIPGVDCNAVGEVRYVVLGDADNDFAAEDESDSEGVPVLQDLAGRQVQAVVDQLASASRSAQTHRQGRGEEHAELEGIWQFSCLAGMSFLAGWKRAGAAWDSLCGNERDWVFGSGKRCAMWSAWRASWPMPATSWPCLPSSGDRRDNWAIGRFSFYRSLAEVAFSRGCASFSTKVNPWNNCRRLKWPVGRARLLPSQASRVALAPGEWLGRSLTLPKDLARSKAFPEPLRTVLGNFWTEMNVADRARLRQVAGRLNAWRKRVDRMAHSDLLLRCLEESGAYAIYAAEAEGELILANLRRLFERIRAEESRSAPGMARLARWMRAQVDDALRDEQAVLAAGQDAVQIMTVHAARVWIPGGGRHENGAKAGPIPIFTAAG